MNKKELLQLLQERPNWKVKIVSDITDEVACVYTLMAQEFPDAFLYKVPETTEIPVRIIDEQNVQAIIIGTLDKEV